MARTVFRSKWASPLTCVAGGVLLLLVLLNLSPQETRSMFYVSMEPKLPSVSHPGWDPQNPLGIPVGKAQNLPSIREADVDNERKIYGGNGDKKHLGGFTEYDGMGVSPNVWKHMIQDYGVHSVLDVGCGRGISTSWFYLHGVDVLCVEGSHDAVERSVLPHPETQVVEHDFSRGPWWPEKTYDAVWAVEFVEHVNVQYHFNYVTAFRKAALLFVSSSRWGGWHHVEVHSDDWWIRKYEAYGFKYETVLTDQVRTWARNEGNSTGPDGRPYNAQHVWLNMKVFVNPVVAALPQHAHLFPEIGCYEKTGENGLILHRECGTGGIGGIGALETPLDPSFFPLKITPDMDDQWLELIRSKSTFAS